MADNLKILHLPESSLPWVTGGKEVFVHTFTRHLAVLGSQNLIAIHQDITKNIPLGHHHYQGLPIEVLPPLPGWGTRRTLFTREFESLPGFRELLESYQPDIVHFHDQNGGASLSHLKVIKEMGIKTVLSFHTPGQTCPQGALLRNGYIPCDGYVTPNRCTTCRFRASHVPEPIAKLMGHLSLPFLDAEHPSRLLRILTARTTTVWFKEALNETIENVDTVMIVAEWCRDLWIKNGCPTEKIHLIRTAGEHAEPKFKPRARKPNAPLRIACMGRFVEIKGFHVLVQAIKALPLDAPIQVQFFGPYADSSYGRKIAKSIQGDPRFLPTEFVRHEDMLQRLSTFHMAAVPSLWLETGPLVVYDAMAAGLPVLGSDLGGISELVEDGKNGLLFPPGDAHLLSQLLERLITEPELLTNLQNQMPTALRNMSHPASEALQLYRRLLA